MAHARTRAPTNRQTDLASPPRPGPARPPLAFPPSATAAAGLAPPSPLPLSLQSIAPSEGWRRREREREAQKRRTTSATEIEKKKKHEGVREEKKEEYWKTKLITVGRKGRREGGRLPPQQVTGKESRKEGRKASRERESRPTPTARGRREGLSSFFWPSSSFSKPCQELRACVGLRRVGEEEEDLFLHGHS